jgi:hypothetical protein
MNCWKGWGNNHNDTTTTSPRRLVYPPFPIIPERNTRDSNSFLFSFFLFLELNTANPREGGYTGRQGGVVVG